MTIETSLRHFFDFVNIGKLFILNEKCRVRDENGQGRPSSGTERGPRLSKDSERQNWTRSVQVRISVISAADFVVYIFPSPLFSSTRDNRKRPHWDNGNKSFDDSDKRPGQRKDQGGGGGGKRPRQNVFSRLEPRNRNQGRNPDYNEVVPRPKISSRVTKEIPRREDVVAAQSDEQSRARNKRIFGSLLMGTLNKFSQDESRLKGRVEKKAIIEKKVEEQELRERETIKQERRNLFIDRKKRLMEVRLLEIKMERMQDLAVFEEAHKQTRQFIRTTAGPKIFFLPKHMNETTTKLLQDSQRQYDGKWTFVLTHTLFMLIHIYRLIQRNWPRNARKFNRSCSRWKSDCSENWK